MSRVSEAFAKLKSNEGEMRPLDRMIVQSRIDTLETTIHFLRVSLQPLVTGHVCTATLNRAKMAYDLTVPDDRSL